LTYCSPAIRDFGGYEPADEIGNHIRIYFADASEMERGLKRFDVMLKNHQPGNFEMLFQPVGRDAFPVEIGLKPVVENDRVVSVMCVMRDISERKAVEMKLKEAQNVLEMRIQERTEALLKINARLENEIQEHERTVNILRESEEKLIQSERLAATGQLAASIAHEINSPLQGVTSLLNVIRRDHSGDRNLVENLDLINGAFSSIRNTVRNLLDLNRPGKEKTQPLRIQEIIDQTGALVKGYLKDNRVRLTVDIPPDLPVIMGSPQQLGQVFMNLINNAVEAMGTDLDDADRYIRIDAAAESGHVVIRVADSGSGISKKDMAHIFDAFFTRKKKMGMGVGLAICHRIIEDHNGSITVCNHADQGAEFSIRLPIEH
jgi:PAS domain S-box-containing protein